MEGQTELTWRTEGLPTANYARKVGTLQLFFTVSVYPNREKLSDSKIKNIYLPFVSVEALQTCVGKLCSP